MFVCVCKYVGEVSLGISTICWVPLVSHSLSHTVTCEMPHFLVVVVVMVVVLLLAMMALAFVLVKLIVDHAHKCLCVNVYMCAN